MESNVEYAVNVIWALMKRVTLWTAGIVFGALILIKIRSIIVFVLIAVLLAYMLLPSVEWLCRRRIPRLSLRTQRLIASIIVLVVFLALVVVTITLIVTPFTNEVGDFGKNFKTYIVQLNDFADKVGSVYERIVPPDIQAAISKFDYSKFTSRMDVYVQQLWSLSYTSIGFIVEMLLIPVLAFYFVLDYRSLTREFYGLVPVNRRREAIRIGRGIGVIMQSYIFGQLILCVIAGILTGIVLAALGMPYVIVLALFAGITRAIPVIGPVVSGIPIILIGMLRTPGDLTIPIYLTIFVIVMHFVESKFIMPRLIGDRMHLHPAIVIIVLLIGAQLFGLGGMFLAAPVAAVIRELIRFYYVRPHSLRPLADKEKDLIIIEAEH